MASAADPYESRFLRNAMSAPLLSAERERGLAVRWRDGGDAAALHELTGAYMRLVVAMANRFRRYGFSMSDLVQEGAVGLMQAAQRFDPDRGFRFSTYAGWWVRAALQDFVLRNWSIVRGGATSGARRLFFNLRRLRARLGDLDGHLSSEACGTIAAELGLDRDDVEAMAARMSAGDRSLDAPLADGAGEDWISLLVDDTAGPEEAVAGKLDGERRASLLSAALATLGDRERDVVIARRLADQPRTLEQLGAEMGVSKERVRQIEAAALGRMRGWISARAGESACADLVA